MALSGLLLMVGGAASVASAEPSPHGNATNNPHVASAGDPAAGATSTGDGTSGATSNATATNSGTASGVTTPVVTDAVGGNSTGASSVSGLLNLATDTSTNSTVVSSSNGRDPHGSTTTAPPSTSTTVGGGAKSIPNPDFVPDSPSTAQSVTVTTEDCNGIIPTPGSKLDRKTLNTAMTSTLSGHAVVHWSVFPYQHNNGGADTLTVHDCVVSYPAGYLVAGQDFNATTGELLTFAPNVLKKNYTVLDTAELIGVTLTTHAGANDTFDYTWSSPTSLPPGTVVCNYAKTTANNSSGDTNRKGGGACFVVPGSPPPPPPPPPPGVVVLTPTTAPTTTTTAPTVIVLPESITTTTVPTSVLPEVLTRTLPFTGGNSQLPVFAGLALVTAGLALLGATRRRDPAASGPMR